MNSRFNGNLFAPQEQQMNSGYSGNLMAPQEQMQIPQPIPTMEPPVPPSPSPSIEEDDFNLDDYLNYYVNEYLSTPEGLELVENDLKNHPSVYENAVKRIEIHNVIKQQQEQEAIAAEQEQSPMAPPELPSQSPFGQQNLALDTEHEFHIPPQVPMPQSQPPSPPINPMQEQVPPGLNHPNSFYKLANNNMIPTPPSQNVDPTFLMNVDQQKRIAREILAKNPNISKDELLLLMAAATPPPKTISSPQVRGEPVPQGTYWKV